MGRLTELLRRPQDTAYYLIGEIAYHHAGDHGFFMRIVDDLCAIGVDAIKVHIMLNADNFVTPTQVEYREYKTWMFPQKLWDESLDLIRQRGLDIIVLADEIEALRYAIAQRGRFGIEAIEIHACSLNECFMLDLLNTFDGIRMLGIGGSTPEEIAFALARLKDVRYENTLLMYGIQNYPTDYAKVKLRNLAALKERYGLEVGYADHTSWDNPFNAFITALGYAAGARVIEKHYSPAAGIKRNDFESAASRDVFLQFKELLAVARQVYGRTDLALNDAEKAYGKVGIGKKGIVARDRIAKGERLSLAKICFKLTHEESDMPQHMAGSIHEYIALRDIGKNEIIDLSKLTRAREGG